MLHVLAAAIWLGGLIALAALLRFVPGRASARAGERFSTIALAAVLVVAATGLVRALTELSSVDQLWTTTYGRALLVKGALLAVLVALGYCEPAAPAQARRARRDRRAGRAPRSRSAC